MTQDSIHEGKETFRNHYLKEWLVERHMKPADLVRLLNEPAEEPPIDKSQIYRWLKGQLPRKPTQIRIAAALSLLDIETNEPDPELLMKRPSEIWFSRKMHGKTPEEIDRAKQAIELLFPEKTGTDG